MNNKTHLINDEVQLEYMLDALEYIDYELGRRQHRLAFNCPQYTEAYEALALLREHIADFSVSNAVDESER